MGFTYSNKLFGGAGSGVGLPSGALTAGRVVLAAGPDSITDDAGLIYNTTTNSLDVTDGRVQAGNLKAIPLPASGSVTVTPVLSKIGAITVVAGSLLADGDSLSVGDGIGVVPIEFDAAPGDGTSGGAVPIVFDGTETATQIRDAVKAILDASGRDWTTSAQGADGIGLVRATPGATGGAITESVTNAGFTVTDWTDPTHATTYTYSLQACLADGTCNAAGAASSTAAGVATLSAANPNRLAWSAVPGAASYKIRRDVGGATQGVIWSGTALTVDDTGLAGDGTGKPIADMTGTVQAGNYKTDVAGNVASGYFSQRALTTGNGNVASGYASQRSLTTGNSNVASGYFSQYSLTTGSYNVASGYQSQYSLTTGSSNVASGYQSQWSLTTGSSNVASGYQSQWSLTTSGNNVASGHQSQRSLTTGSGNVASGYRSGYTSGATPNAANAITTSTNTTFIGYLSGLGSPTQRTNSTAIGANAYVDADNTVVLGDAAVTDVLAGSTGAARVRAGTLTLSNLPVYADNAAALGGGLTAGQIYRTSTGVLMVTY